MNNFAYPYYLKLIKTIQNALPLKDFSEINDQDASFFILRHDVEFSIERAWELARLECDELGITSSYFFQMRNYAYNPLAFKNISLIKEIRAMGHRVGLHVNHRGWVSLENISGFVKKEVELFQNSIDLPIDRFSFHRPTPDLLKLNLQTPGLINAYDKKFFHFYEKDSPSQLNVYYCSDSEHRWKFGEPLSMLKKSIKKMQLLIHPYSWSPQGLDNVSNFKALIQNKQTSILEEMNNECNHFPKELLK